MFFLIFVNLQKRVARLDAHRRDLSNDIKKSFSQKIDFGIVVY